MRKRIAIVAVISLVALALQACGAVNCGAAGGSDRAGGGCRAHTTF